MSGPRPAVEAALDEVRWPPEVRGGRVAVAVPDATRPVDAEAMLDPLLGRLAGAGRVTVVVALGLHRPMTGDELAPWSAICRRHGADLEQHDAFDPARLTRLGAAGRIPAVFSRTVAEADLVVCVGLVEPHQYAGYSGGVKTVAVGCAGAETVSALHGLELLRDPRTTLGVVNGNPFRAALDGLAARLPPVYALQLVPPDEAGRWAATAGPAAEAFEAAVAGAARSAFVDHPRRYSAVVVAVPEVKAQSLYQASRAATYVALVEGSVVKDGGAVILEAACPEGLGAGAGERAFARALERGVDALRHELATSDRPLAGGEQRAFVLARTLARVRLAVVGAPAMPPLERVGVVQADTVAGAAAALGLSEAPVRLEDPFRRLPRLREVAA